MPDPKPAKSGPLRLVLALAAVVLVVVAGLLWLNRKTLAREALTGWLKSRGAPAEAQVEAFGPTTFRARLRIGAPGNPDFAADGVEVRYRLGVGGLQVQSVLLRRPVLRANLREGKLSLGALDPLVQQFLKAPPPTTRQPRITIENGLLLLGTDYGPVRMAANAVVDDSKLVSLAGTTAATRLKGPAFDAEVGEMAVREATADGRIIASVEAPITRITAGEASARGARLSVRLEASYPDLAKRRGDGALVLNATLAGREVAFAGRKVEGATLSASFIGRSTGWVEDLAVTGRATASLRAGRGDLGGGSLASLRAVASAEDVRWTRKGGDRASAQLVLNGGAADLRAADLTLTSLTATAKGPVAWDAGEGVQVELAGSAVGRGGWDGLGPTAPADGPELANLKRAARSFRLAAPEVSLAATGSAFTLGLPRPIRLVPDSGGAVELSGRPGAALIGSKGGAFTLTSAGGGLPSVRADVERLGLTAGGLAADARLAVRGSFGVLQGTQADLAGRLAVVDGKATFSLVRCATLKAERLEFGANDVEAVGAQICAAGGPLVRADSAGWRVAGRALGVTAAAPFVQARVSGVAVNFGATGRAGDVAMRADVVTGQIEDTAPATRFNPLALTGAAQLSEFVWTADLVARQPGADAIGRMRLVHDGGLGLGFMSLDTGDLTFAEAGLQPSQLSPLASVVGSPVTGQARFEGRFDWARQGASSGGSVSLKDLDFQSPAGRIEDLNGALKFASLAPLTAEPGQTLSIGLIDSIVPLTNLNARFAVADNLLKIAGGEALVGGGRILIESLEAPLAADAPSRGVLVFERVQLHDVIEASPFGDKVELDARVSGRVAFEANGSQVRISEGELKAVAPGRVSIDRTALTGVQADGEVSGPAAAAAAPDPNATVTDLAYQAMEHLAFDRLELTLASRRDGRLGALFHIVGRHDPPSKQSIRLSVIDLARRRFMERKLPLPSGTKVNLTLDTSLNLDDLLADYAEYRRLHGSAQVQPTPPNPTP